MAGTTGYPRLMAAGGSANDAFLDAITAAVDTLDTYVARVNAAATISAGDKTTFKMQGLNGPTVSGATRTVKLLGRLGSEDQTFLDALNAIADTFTAYRTAVNANAAIVAGDTTCYKVQDVNGAAVSGATVFYRSTSRFDTDLDDLETQINGMVDALSQFASAWNLKQGGTPTTLVVCTVKRLRPFTRPADGVEDATRNVAIDGGDSQSATVNTQPTTALTVVVTDGSGTVVEGEQVTWSTTSDGSITATSLTNASGIATATPTLGTVAGPQTFTATTSTGAAVSFTLTGTAGEASSIAANSATSQTGTTSQAVAAPPSVIIRDAFGNVKSGVTVTFAVTAGGGSRDPATVNSSSAGIATLTSWTLGGTAGANTLTATAAGLSGSPVTFSASGTAAAPTQIAVQSGGSQTGVTAGQAATATVFRVKDVSNNAVEGVTAAFTITSGNGSLSVASAVTDASGDASVTYTTDELVETATIRGAFTNAAGTEVATTTTIASTFGTKSKLAIQTQPSSNGSSGTALSQQPIILIQDANGNTVTSATDTITASVQSGNAVLTAGSTKAAVAGVATFSGMTLTDTDAGANVLRFSSGALTTVDSSDVTLAPPVPVALQFSGPINNVTEDTGVLTFNVLVVDSNSTTVPGATNAVTVALTTPSGATLSGDVTVNAVAGVASFGATEALAVDTAGTYTLTATATGLSSAVSSPFTVSAAVGSGGLNPNMPVTITTYRERFWNAQNDAASPGNVNTEGGWYDSTAHTWPQVVAIDDATLVSDMTSGQIAQLYKGSASRVGKSQFTGSGDGTSPTLSSFQNGVSGTGFNSDEVYASLVFAPSLNWDQITSYKLFQFSTHTPGTNANSRVGVVVHIRANQSSKFGDTTTPLTLDLVISVNSAGGTTEVRATAGTITRGSANHVEIYCKLNTNGALDGICKMWFNGTLVMDRSNLGYRGGSGTILGGDKFYLVNLYSSKGGPTTSDTIAAACRLYYGYTGIGFA